MKVAVDGIIFGYFENDLNILLIKRLYEPFKGMWSLPGGFVKEEESLDDAVYREIREETNIHNLFLEQLYSFGEVNRDPRKRVISVSYYGLVKPDKFNIKADTDASDVKWFSMKNLPELPFDHEKIVNVAYQRLKGKVTYEPIGFELLDNEFTIPQLQSLYQTILDKEIDRRNFRKKILKLDILDDLNKNQKDVSHKPGKLYSFNKKKYENKLDKGLFFEI